MLPILSPDSTVKVRHTWCARDPSKTWDAWMLEGKTPPAVECSALIEKLLDLGRRLRVRGTPTLFFEDGSRANGILPLEQLQSRLK
jgi:thiol:disulfide interchange protein DsbC